ncbi:MAG: UDP-N-acetylmuramoyl-L-alanine--D-glutamate ligase [Clostridium sp.]|nr:UDP-N-acetylmuramoyl-L-alanine--D-glutamate ligase [Clostridium sp.]
MRNQEFQQFIDKVKGKKVGVVGLGVSNLPLISFLLGFGAEVYGFDQREISSLPEQVHEMKGEVSLYLGKDYLNHLKGMDLIFKTPGMRRDEPKLLEAEKAGAKITSEMEEFLTYCPGRTIGVTGSDGKTTTTTVIGEILKQAGHKVYVGGNIGNPLLTKVQEITPSDFVVLELSSFQLMTMDVSPEISVVTNLSPNHLDMHKDMEEYILAKKNIFLHQEESDLLILNEDNAITKSFAKEAKGEVVFFSSIKENEDAYFREGSLYIREERIVDLEEMKVKGIHNAENFLAAFLATEQFVSKSILREVAISFNGVKHRCQLIRELDGVKYYNDSIASSPTRTLASIGSLDRKVNIILGGYDKKLDYTSLAEEGHQFIKNAILVGDTKLKIQDVFKVYAQNEGVVVKTYLAESFEEAVDLLRSVSEEGDIAILSPASASFDMFRNFEERGDKFVALVNNF